jgi:predicted nucleotidyltransferase
LKTHSIRVEYPLDPDVVTILSEVSRVAAECDIEYLVVGATARDILLTHVFGSPARRATNDVDFAIAVESWDKFEEVKSRLKSKEGFNISERQKQRMYYKSHPDEHGYPFDLVPFGGIEQNTNEIVWPPDMEVTMNVAGYEEVLKAAEQVVIAPGVTVRVASLAGLAILKLIAWSDRGKDNPKDAHDLYQIMTKYTDAGNTDRLYDSEFPTLEAADHDPEIAGACLLGKDTANLANDETYKHLTAILEQDYDRLTLEMVRSIRNADDAQERVGIRLSQFKLGILMR